MHEFTLKNSPALKGKIAIVTGANQGVGYYTTLGLASKGAKVILASRDQKKVEKAMADIKKELPKADLAFIPLDLNSLKSVHSFATTFKQEYGKLDILVNNAGIMIPPFAKTEEGFESQMGVNYFAHFLLTGLLMEQLEKADNARVVSLSSIAHKSGKIDFDNLNAEKFYSKGDAYNQSKLACLMFAYELDRKLKQSKSKIVSVAAHPGVSDTNLMQNLPAIPRMILALLMSPILNSPRNAAMPSLMAAMDSKVIGGEYYGPTGFMEMSGKPAKVVSKPHAQDIVVAKKLWEVSEKLVDYKFAF